MTKKTRFIILSACALCFIIIAPILVLYSMGDRFDFEKFRITKTGGIYIRTFPAAEQITIDSKITEKPGMFSNSVFVQSLIPDEHTVLIQKNGYYDYFKTLPVVEEQVTKLENVLLLRENMQFEVATEEIQSPFAVQERFIIKKNNLYYSDADENIGITATQKSTPILKGLVSFSFINNDILWLGTDGILYKSSLSADKISNPTKLTTIPIKIIKTGIYKIIPDDKDIFIIDNGNLLSLDNKTDELFKFSSSITDAIISPDNKNIVTYNNNSVYISSIPNAAIGAEIKKNVLLYKSSEKINDCIWLNNDYIVLVSGDKIIISEIDHRGNINAVVLPQTISVSTEEKIEVSNPKIYFNPQERKLYILIDKTLLLSEPIGQ